LRVEFLLKTESISFFLSWVAKTQINHGRLDISRELIINRPRRLLAGFQVAREDLEMGRKSPAQKAGSGSGGAGGVARAAKKSEPKEDISPWSKKKKRKV